MAPWSFDLDEPDVRKRIEKVLAYYHDPTKDQTADNDVVKNLTIVSAAVHQPRKDEPPHLAKAVFTLPVLKSWVNATSNMHGGIIAMLIDVTTTFTLSCIASRNKNGDNFWKYPGVSRNLTVTYLKPVPTDITVRVECTITSVGKRLVSMQAVVRDHDTGAILCTGQHDKVSVEPPKPRDDTAKL